MSTAEFIEYAGGAARIKGGSLAGSILQLKDAVKNVVEWGIPTPGEVIYLMVIVVTIYRKRECDDFSCHDESIG
jgi:N-acetylglucosamine-6-phosphate deacetylase